MASSRAAFRAGARVLRAGSVALLLLAPLASGCAYLSGKAELQVNEIAQETRVLRGQQRDLTDEVGRIRSLLESEGLVGDEQRAALLSRLDALERAVVQMVARSEEQDAMLQRMAAALDQLARQAGFAPGGAAAGPPPGTAPGTVSAQPEAAPGSAGGETPPAQAAAPAAATPAAPAAAANADSGSARPVDEGSTELAIYDAARGDFARGNYALARDGFDELLRRFPASSLADNAAYWLAESFYAEAQYLQALERYEEILIAYPEGDVRPAALLKTGYCRLELGFPEEAARSFERLRLLFPDSNEAAIATHKLSGMSAGH